ncbi:MAG: S8 family serine peptidase [Burkholderiaceae bacterium]|nr:S8 family serine peptidase [Burkholderiaceae bacterium]
MIKNRILTALFGLFVSTAILAGTELVPVAEPVTNEPARVLLSGVKDPNLATAASNGNSALTQLLEHLRQQALKQGEVRVIVGLRVPFAPDAALSAASAQAQRAEIQATQFDVLGRFPQVREEARYKTFEFIPFMAMTLTSEELAVLLVDPAIIGIEEDKLNQPSLVESVPIIGGSAAFNMKYTGSGQTIAILDTGVDKAHPFLADKVVSEACYSTTNGTATSVCPGGVAASTASGSGVHCALSVTGCAHGTHVAGIAAGKWSSTFSGVAKDAKLIAVQIFSRFPISSCGAGATAECALAYTSDIISGLNRVYALKDSFKIAAVNMSLGGGKYTSYCDATESSTKTAIDNLVSAKIPTVIASGNDGYSDGISAPGCISSAVSVGSTWDVSGQSNSCKGNNLGTSAVDSISCFSNSYPNLSLLAPGIWTYSSTPNNTYANYSGTSMATPHVAGVMALLRQDNKNRTPTARTSLLQSTGVSVWDSRNSTAFKRVQVDSALQAQPRPFIDVALGNPFSAYISTIFSVDITQGCAVTLFTRSYCPTQYVTRSDMAAFLVRARDGVEPALCSVAPFNDVPTSNVYCKYIKRLKDLAITTGCQPGFYCPDGLVTREEMAIFIVRTLEGNPAPNYCGGVSPYTDVSPSSPFCGHIKRLKELDVTQGVGGGLYAPSANVTREQMAAFLARGFLNMK